MEEVEDEAEQRRPQAVTQAPDTRHNALGYTCIQHKGQDDIVLHRPRIPVTTPWATPAFKSRILHDIAKSDVFMVDSIW